MTEQKSSDATVIALVTGCMSTEEEIRQACWFLDSIVHQVTKPDALYASFYIPESVNEDTRSCIQTHVFEKRANQLTATNAQGNETRVLWQTELKPTFIQYQELIHQFLSTHHHHQDKVWICFSKAQDLWHPNRISCVKGIATVIEDAVSVKAIVTPQYTLLHDSNLQQDVDTPKSITTLMEHQQLTIPLNQSPDRQHINLCVRFPMLQQFLRHHSFLVHHNSYCDLAFIHWVWNVVGAEHIVVDMKHWLYFSRNGVLPHQHSGKRDVMPMIFESLLSEEEEGKKKKDDSVNYTGILKAAIEFSEIPGYQELAKRLHARVLAQCKNRTEQEVYMLIYETLRKERILKQNRFLGKACSSCTRLETECKLMYCSACKMVRYCSVECQRKHWYLHKDDCLWARTYGTCCS